MDFDLPELVNLTLKATLSLLFILGALDTVYAIILAVIRQEFSATYVINFLWSHIGRIWFPIFALAVIGHGVPALDVPPIGAAGLAANLSIVAYAVFVLKSLVVSTQTTKAPV